MFRTHWMYLAAALLQGIMITAAPAQKYPDKAIRLILPVSPGGAGDVYARPLAQRLTEMLGQSIVIDHRPGATSTIGLGIAAKSAPDGYTLVWGSTSSLSMGSALYSKLPYDPVSGFSPITPVVAFPNVLVVNASMPVNSTSELIEYAKGRPGPMTFSSSGSGSTNHLTAALFQTITKMRVTHVPYKGGGPALIDLMGGHVDAMFATVPSAVAHVKSGKLRPLMITSAGRVPALPNVPSGKESGLPNFVVSNWNGVLAPAGTPPAIVNTLNAAIVKFANSQEMRERMAAQATDVYTTTPAEFAAVIRDDFAKWSKVIREFGVKAEE
jgi:tripartite-type tricarboxylate transporter receptor subunit TctC